MKRHKIKSICGFNLFLILILILILLAAALILKAFKIKTTFDFNFFKLIDTKNFKKPKMLRKIVHIQNFVNPC
jgi:hypothetical protein